MNKLLAVALLALLGLAAVHGVTTTAAAAAGTTAAPAAEEGAAGEEGKEEEKEEPEDEASPTAAVVLLGTVAFAMAIFYLVNSAWKGVSEQTWSMLSAAISIFVGVMFYNALNKFTRIIFKMEPTEDEEEVPMNQVWRHVAEFMTWWVVLCSLMYINRQCKLRLVAYGTIAGHIMGFSAIGLYGDLARTGTFNSSASLTFAVLAIYVITVPIVCLPIRCLFSLVEKVAGTDDKMVDRVHDQAKDTGTDFFCMGASAILSMAIRGLIIGKVAEVEAAEEAEKPHEGTQVGRLIIAGLVFLVAAGSLKVIGRRMKKASDTVKEILEVITTTTALTAAWCLLGAAMWFYLPRYSCKVVGHLVVAALFSIVFAIAVHLISCVKNATGIDDVARAFRGELTALGLALGLSWEATFDASLEAAGKLVSEENEQNFVFLTTLFLVLIVFPAWVAYILPKHDADLSEYKNKKLHPIVACGDCCQDDDDEEYEEVDEEG